MKNFLALLACVLVCACLWLEWAAAQKANNGESTFPENEITYLTEGKAMPTKEAENSPNPPLWRV